MKKLRRLLKILKDEGGLFGIDDALLIGGAMAGGGSILGGVFGKNKQKTIDPYAQLRGQYQKYLGNKLGTTTPYSFNPAFEVQQPDIEKQAEGAISTGLDRGYDSMKSDFSDIYNKYYEARKAKAAENFADEQKATANMYNRLGLVSSTPGLQAQTDLGRKQSLDLNELYADIAREGIGNEMQATALANDIMQQYINQGQQLGQTQRSGQEFAMNMSEADIARMINEEQGYAGLANSLLSGNPPQIYFEPNAWSQIGSGLTNIGSTILGGGMMGNQQSSLQKLLEESMKKKQGSASSTLPQANARQSILGSIE